MHTHYRDIRSALGAVVVLGMICCGVYPFAVWGIGQTLFNRQANGSLIEAESGTTLGSELIGQRFVSVRYFHSRPSAAGVGYDATSSGGSNLGPTSKQLRLLIAQRVAAYRLENGLKEGEMIPADAVTASGSGLDPHISVRNAELQTPRIARARGLAEDRVRELVRQHTESPRWGIIGDSAVHVLKLNLALDLIQ